MTSDGTNVTGAYSTDGTTGRPSGGRRRCRRTRRSACSRSPTTAATATRSRRSTGSASDRRRRRRRTPSGPSRDDEFYGATLDKTRWNAIVRDNPSAVHGRRRQADDHDRARRHLHGRHEPAAEQLHPPVGGPRRRGLGDRDQAVGHDQRRLRPGRPDGLRGRRQLREVRRDLRRRQHADQPPRAALGGRRRGPGPAAERRRAGGHDRHLAAAEEDRHELLGRVLVRRHDLDGDRRPR